MILEKQLYELIEEKLKKLNKLRPISSSLLIKLQEKFEIEMTYNSNAIEGNTLTLKETYWVIQEGITVKGKPLKDHLEAKNHKEALDFLYELIDNSSHSTISEQLIKTLHSLVIQNIDKDIAGKYRNVDVFISGSNHTPPKALDIPDNMNNLIKWAKLNYKKISIIDFASIIHHKFVHIHPFQDGNGRTGRLLMNIFLMNHGFPLVIIEKNDRQKYYKALESADNNNYKPLTKLTAQAVLKSLNVYLDVLTPSKEKDKYISLAKISEFTSYSQDYLSKLAKNGKIDAHKEGRNWVTTETAISNYMKDRKRKRKL